MFWQHQHTCVIGLNSLHPYPDNTKISSQHHCIGITLIFCQILQNHHCWTSFDTQIPAQRYFPPHQRAVSPPLKFKKCKTLGLGTCSARNNKRILEVGNETDKSTFISPNRKLFKLQQQAKYYHRHELLSQYGIKESSGECFNCCCPFTY